MAEKKKFIQKAIKRPGAFTAFCKGQGFTGVTEECIRIGIASKSKVTRGQAVLARTLRKISKNR